MHINDVYRSISININLRFSTSMTQKSNLLENISFIIYVQKQHSLQSLLFQFLTSITGIWIFGKYIFTFSHTCWPLNIKLSHPSGPSQLVLTTLLLTHIWLSPPPLKNRWTKHTSDTFTFSSTKILILSSFSPRRIYNNKKKLSIKERKFSYVHASVTRTQPRTHRVAGESWGPADVQQRYSIWTYRLDEAGDTRVPSRSWNI